MRTKLWTYAFGITAALLYALPTAKAQIYEITKDREETSIDKRIANNSKTNGYYMGAFIVQPKIELEGKYDSNIYAQSTNETSDYNIAAKPSISILKEYKDHKFLLKADAEMGRFLDQTSENFENYDISFDANIVGNSHWEFPFSFLHSKKVRERDTPLVSLTPNERLDTRYTTIETGIKRNFNRLSISLLGNYSNVSFEDGVALDNVTPTLYSDNNHERVGGTLRFRYDFPRNANGSDAEHILFTNLIFGNNTYEKRDFQNNSFSGAYGDHKEYGFLTGFITHYKGLLFANVGAGLKHLSFADRSLKDTQTAKLSADVDYNLTPKLTLNLKALRDIDQDNGLVSGVITSDYKIGADYELQHNLFIGSEFGYTNYNFNSLSREDDDYLASLYMKYQNNRNIESVLRLNYGDRQSNIPGRDYDRTEIIFSLVGKI